MVRMSRTLSDLVGHWRDHFDWRAQGKAERLSAESKVRLEGIDLHFLHVPGNGPDPHPLLLSHGWPGSVFEFLELIPRLTDRSGSEGIPPMRSRSSLPLSAGVWPVVHARATRYGIEAIADCFPG